MPTLIASIAALTVALIGAVSAIWAIVRDRERLRALERVSGLLEVFEHGSHEWELIHRMQTDLAEEVYSGHVVRLLGIRWMRWARNLIWIGMVPLVIAIPLFYFGSSLGAVCSIIGIVLFMIGFVFYGKSNAMNRNGRKRIERHFERLAPRPSDETM